MKTFIIIFFFFVFYFVSIKNLYNENIFLNEDIEILEYEAMEKDSIIHSLNYKNSNLEVKIKDLKLQLEQKPVIRIKKVKLVDTTSVILEPKEIVIDSLRNN